MMVEQNEGILHYHSEIDDVDIIADHTHLKNVLFNLIDNAIKYSSQSPEIHLNTSSLRGKVRISIKDNGIGVEKNDIAKLFDKFFRVSTGNVHNAKGFGLGLYYVKLISDAHDWELQVSSKPGVGSTFNIFINPENEA